MSLLNSDTFVLASAYAVALYELVEKTPATASRSSNVEDVLPPPLHSWQSPGSSLSNSDVSLYNISSANFTTSCESDVSSLGLSDSTDFNMFTDTSDTVTRTSLSSGRQDILQTKDPVPLKQPSRKVSKHSSSEQFIGSSNVRMTRSTSKRNASPYLTSDLDLINVEADRQAFLGRPPTSVQNDALTSSVESRIPSRRTRSQKKKKNIRSWKTLKEMDMWQKQWIEKIRLSQFSRSAAIAHVTESWKALNDTYSTLQGRSSEMQQSLRLYACNAIKLVEYLTVRGYEVSALLPEFILCVIGVYLKRPRHLNEFDRSWLQSREVTFMTNKWWNILEALIHEVDISAAILRMVCEIPWNIDTLMAVLSSIGEAKLRFMRTMTSDCIDRDISFMDHAIKELNDLESRTSQRIHQLQRKEVFGLPT